MVSVSLVVAAVDPARGGLVASLGSRAATLPECRSNSPILSASGSNSCARLSPSSAESRSCSTLDYSSSVLEASDVKATARTLGLDFASLEIRRREDIPPTFEALKAKADALYVVSDALIAVNRTRIITLALNARLPTILSYRDYVEAGGLMSMVRTSRTCSGAPPTWSTRFCAGRNRATFRSSRPTNSNWLSISRPPRYSAWKFQRRCSLPLTT